MKKYLSLFRIRLINSVQYRAVTFGAVAANVLSSNLFIRLGKKNCDEYACCGGI